MPHSSYALFKGIRNHRIASPRVAPVSAGGPPNACNLCHLDRSLAWTQDWLVRWYGRAPVNLTGSSTNSAIAEWLLEGHAAQRIIAAWHLGWAPALKTSGGSWISPLLAASLDDDYGPVRFVAARSLRAQPGLARLEFDFIAPSGERKAAIERILGSLPTNTVSASPRPDCFETNDRRPDISRTRAAIARQDRRSVTISE